MGIWDIETLGQGPKGQVVEKGISKEVERLRWPVEVVCRGGLSSMSAWAKLSS